METIFLIVLAAFNVWTIYFYNKLLLEVANDKEKEKKPPIDPMALVGKGLENSLIVSRNSLDAAKAILNNLDSAYCDNTRTKQQQVLDFKCINENVIDLYENS